MLHQSKYFLDLFDCCYDNQSTVPICLAVKTRPLGMAFDFPKIDILGNSLGKVDERIKCPVGGVLIDPVQKTVLTDSRLTLRII
jgi:hypothetical protein